MHSLFLIIVTGMALTLGTVAWFTNNKKVSGNNVMVTISTPSSVYIMPSGESTRTYVDSASVSFEEKKLFPISTGNCVDWYYVNGISNNKANSYAKATFADAAAIQSGKYQNSFEYAEKYAYSLSDFVIYTDFGTVDMYLDPTDPIRIEYVNKEDNDLTHIDETLRIGIVAEGTGSTESLLMVYAPAAENGTGNSQSQTANQFYAVTGTSSDSLQTVSNAAPYLLTIGGVQSGATAISTYTAVERPDGNNIYATTETAVKICSADPNGKNVKIYVWMEGTDAQSVINSPQHRNYFSESLSITVNLVGIEQ